MPDSDASVRIQGEAVYFEKILMPEGSRLRVQVLDNQLADTPAAVLAERVTTVGAGPYEFVIDVPRTKLRDGGQYGLHASVSMPDDSLRFVTDTRVPVAISATSLGAHVGQIRLRHVQP
ncbi:MAG: YbaY family lipoprotein [Luteimonas sp.]